MVIITAYEFHMLYMKSSSKRTALLFFLLWADTMTAWLYQY